MDDFKWGSFRHTSFLRMDRMLRSCILEIIFSENVAPVHGIFFVTWSNHSSSRITETASAVRIVVVYLSTKHTSVCTAGKKWIIFTNHEVHPLFLNFFSSQFAGRVCIMRSSTLGSGQNWWRSRNTSSLMKVKCPRTNWIFDRLTKANETVVYMAIPEICGLLSKFLRFSCRSIRWSFHTSSLGCHWKWQTSERF